MLCCLFSEWRTHPGKKPKMLQMSGHNMFSESLSWQCQLSSTICCHEHMSAWVEGRGGKICHLLSPGGMHPSRISVNQAIASAPPLLHLKWPCRSDSGSEITDASGHFYFYIFYFTSSQHAALDYSCVCGIQMVNTGTLDRLDQLSQTFSESRPLSELKFKMRSTALIFFLTTLKKT